jgi:hypothetical protein
MIVGSMISHPATFRLISAFLLSDIPALAKFVFLSDSVPALTISFTILFPYHLMIAMAAANIITRSFLEQQAEPAYVASHQVTEVIATSLKGLCTPFAAACNCFSAYLFTVLSSID